MEEDIVKHDNSELYYEQKALLDTFLEHGAITQAQHDHSLKCLTEKMMKGVNDDRRDNG